jgi:hypothetical protein
MPAVQYITPLYIKQNSTGRAMRLTQKTVDSLKAAKGSRVEWDDAVPGFGVAVKKGEEPIYVVRFCIEGRQRDFALARTSKLDLKSARGVAARILSLARAME